MSRYTTKLQNIMEANIRLEKRLLTEQQQSSDQEYKVGEVYSAKRSSDGKEVFSGNSKMGTFTDLRKK